jgi:GABA(A) receptor-associated protein
MGFKNDYDENSRFQESKKILLKYPTRIPIIVEKHEKCQFEEINKKKYLVPKNMPMNQFIFIIRKRIKLDPSKTLFVMVNDSLASSAELLGDIYETKKDTDGFMYIKYSSENTFG